MLPPKLPAAEALSQEISALRRRFSGDLIYVNPNAGSPVYVPRHLFGFHTLPRLHRQKTKIDLYHLYNPDPFPYPFLRWLKQPVVYSITGGVSSGYVDRLPITFFNSLAAVTVYDEESMDRLQAAGVQRAYLIRPGIDTTRFSTRPLPLQDEIRLLIASAPWTTTQFQTKGVDALLAAAQQLSRLRLVFLWRGVLLNEMIARVQRLGLHGQVTVLDGEADVNAVLATVHAGVVLASNPAIIKAYPHSLLDSLAAGKPVLISRAIPMANYVMQVGCGQVVEAVTSQAILAAVEGLVANYTQMCRIAETVGQRDFSQTGMLAGYEEVYAAAKGQRAEPSTGDHV